MRLDCTYFPHRYLLSFTMFLGLATVYFIRTSFIFTLKTISRYDELDTCSAELNNLGEKKQVQILETFEYAYAIFHLPAAILAKRGGGKLALGLGVLLFSISSILFPFAVCVSIYSLAPIRILMGAAMSIVMLSLLQVTSQWSPLNERSLIVATVAAGFPVGMLLSWMLLARINNNLLDFITWQLLYQILGVIGIVWCLIWNYICYDKPEEHPFISTLELDYLRKYVPQTYRKMPTPWLAIFKSKPFWALFISYLGHDYTVYTAMTRLPVYYHDVSKLSDSKNSDLSAAAFLLVYFGIILLGFLSDKIITLKWTTATHLRRLLATIGLAGPGIGMVCASYLTDNISQVIITTMFVAFVGLGIITFNVNFLDLSYNHCVAIMCLCHGIGTFTGIISTRVTETILHGPNRYGSQDDKIIKWQDVSWVIFAVQVISTIPFLLFGSAQVQPWDNPSQEPSSSNQQRISTQSHIENNA